MYQSYLIDSKQVDIVLNNLYTLIGDSVNKGEYSFKGGYILRKRLGNNIRRTTDLDLSIYKESTFEVISVPVIAYLETLKSKGVIWDYSVKTPKIRGLRNISGGFKLYLKLNENTPKKLFCSVDISIHKVGKGIELTPEGYPVYSNELMLCDKVKVLYSDEYTVFRRIRDVADIYLLINLSGSLLNKDLILMRLKELKVNISKISVLEMLLCSPQQSIKINESLSRLLSDDIKYNKNSQIKKEEVLNTVCKFLTILRGSSVE